MEILEILLRLLILTVALGGFLVAFHIWRKKRRAEKLICPLNSNCEIVVHSRYSTFLGQPLESLGLVYYFLMIVSQTGSLLSPVWRASVLSSLILWLTIMAFIFSVYLLYIQAVKLREWCAWCLLSAIFCSIIFLVSLKIASIV